MLIISIAYLHSSTHPARWHPELPHTWSRCYLREQELSEWLSHSCLLCQRLLSFPGSVSLASESISCCLWLVALSVSRFHWLLYFLPFLTLISPLQGSAPTGGLGMTEIPHGSIESSLLSLFRGCTMLDLLLSLIGITQHATDTQQLTQIRMTVSVMIWSPEEGGSELVRPSC